MPWVEVGLKHEVAVLVAERNADWLEEGAW